MAGVLLSLPACEHGHDHSHPHPHPHPHPDSNASTAKSDHGTEVELGTVKVGGRELRVARFGEVVPGTESAFEVHGVGMSTAELGKMNIYLWVEDEGGNQLSAPAKGALEGDGLHFHVSPRKGRGTPVRVVTRLRDGDLDERGTLPLDGKGR